MFQKAQKKVIKLVDFLTKITFGAKYTSVHGKGLEMLTPNQMLQKLLIALAQKKQVMHVFAMKIYGNASKKLLNKIC